jgi:hypothetical protein
LCFTIVGQSSLPTGKTVSPLRRATVEVVVTVAAKHGLYSSAGVLKPPLSGNELGFFEHILA